MGDRQIRENEGFIIIASKRTGLETEVVMGFNPQSSQYVTWLCYRGDDYNYGHYGTDFNKAVQDYRRRCRDEA